eukprot:53441_1
MAELEQKQESQSESESEEEEEEEEEDAVDDWKNRILHQDATDDDIHTVIDEIWTTFLHDKKYDAWFIADPPINLKFNADGDVVNIKQNEEIPAKRSTWGHLSLLKVFLIWQFITETIYTL